MNKFLKMLNEKDYIIFDGAMGTQIQRICNERNVEFQIPETLNFSHPEIIKEVIKSYAESGSDMVCANTFGANRFKLSELNVAETIKKAVEIAREALVEYPDVLVGADCSTLGKLLEPGGTLTFEEAYAEYRDIAIATEQSGADFMIIETMTDIYELKAALLAVKENTQLPVICSMSFEANGRTFTGCPPSAMAIVLKGLGADCLGVNCSLGPKELVSVVEELIHFSNGQIPIMVKPNAGLPDPYTGEFSLCAEDFATQMAEFATIGGGSPEAEDKSARELLQKEDTSSRSAIGGTPIKVFGGCCGTSPEYIKRLKFKLQSLKVERHSDIHENTNIGTNPPCLCSATRTVVIDQPRIIGERINPTGKKRFKEALLNNDIDYILSLAIEQVSAGAEILDINVGLPGIDEKEIMTRVVKAVQSVVDVPLQIDSGEPAVIEAALRVCNGVAIVNSVNGEDTVLNAILPIVKKYGACVLGLTLDKNGIPPKASERFKIAEKILNTALSFGIEREKVFIDCLTLTASAQQEAVRETLKAVRLIKQQLGLKTVLGVSNVSFGLPNRELINHTFLAMALENGLDLPIINPNVHVMRDTVRAFKVLSGHDKNSVEYISGTAEHTTAEPMAENLEYAVIKGLKAAAKDMTVKLLNELPAIEIAETELIPALDKVGVLFESGKLFLPQLILSAETAGVCFELIKSALDSTGEKHEQNEKIVLATVKGDIHDIGKNIVKILLENYGYKIIDLGKDVSEETIVNAAHGVKLVGLSALMTTTLPAMENTIKSLRKACPDCKIAVGGAVLTEDYALKIGADYYAKDAQGAVSIAKKVFGKKHK